MASGLSIIPHIKECEGENIYYLRIGGGEISANKEILFKLQYGLIRQGYEFSSEFQNNKHEVLWAYTRPGIKLTLSQFKRGLKSITHQANKSMREQINTASRGAEPY